MRISEPSEVKGQSGLKLGAAITKTAAERWDEQMRAWQKCQAVAGRRSLSAWESDRAARRYWEQVCFYQQERLNLLISRLQPTPGKRILDIGSGPGVLSIPLAERGAKVTAVDPSSAMLNLLKQIATERGVAEIRCLDGRWEELDPVKYFDGNSPYQAVVASLSLMMVGIRESLLKMMRVCAPGGRIYLLWGRGKNHWTEQLSKLYPGLYGFNYVPKPEAKLLLEVVLELEEELAGREPAISTQVPGLTVFSDIKAEEFDFFYRESFDSEAEALNHFLDYFGVEEANRSRVDLVQEFLGKNLRHNNGSLLLEHSLPTLLITITIGDTIRCPFF
ncbi:MAG: class I SAM-dependent methyltransferase [Candidatus Saccharicenans sp.]|nr:class I SAM-dependent methyltransferase [Candidatus Saccharicenans sp.]